MYETEPRTRIQELANEIARNTAIVSDYLVAHNLAQPSFDIDGPVDMTFELPEVERARIASIAASTELQDLLQGPIACLRPAINATSLEAIYRYNIAMQVPIDGREISFHDLAIKCNMYEPNLRRILRYAILYHRVFCERRAGYVTHSAASLLLAKDPVMYDTLGMMYDESWQAFARTCDAMQRYDSQEPDKTGYSLAHCPSTTVWSYYNSCPARAKRFASAMKSLTSSPGQSTEYLAKGYSWHSLPIGSKVIDMGGSEGHVSIAIAQMHKHLHFVVQDLPDVIDGVHLGHAVEDTTRERIRFIAHDFLKNQTVEGDVFLFRWVLHDWPDKFYDLCMLSFFNSREREKEDWQNLFHEADERFGNIKIWTPEGASLAIIEATWTL